MESSEPRHGRAIGRWRHDARSGARDDGASLIEILIAVILLGTLVAATLSALATTISASANDRDHANAHAWLQTAADMLYAYDVRECQYEDAFGNPIPPATEIAATIAEYQTLVSQTENPEDWPASNIEVVDLEWWAISDPDPVTGLSTESWGQVCDRRDTNLQKVQLRVRNNDGRIVEEVEVIIGGR